MTTDSGDTSVPNPSSTNVPESLLVLHHSQLMPIEAEIEKCKAELKRAKDKLKLHRRVMERDGIDLKVFDETRAEFLADEADTRQRYAIKAFYHRAFKSPFAAQLDLFEQPDRRDMEEKWRFDGWRAGASGIDSEKCEHLPTDTGWKHWMAGWKAAQAAIIAGMAIHEQEDGEEAKDAPEARIEHASDCATHNAPAYEAGPCDCGESEDLGAEAQGDDDQDWPEERDACDPPTDEDSALKGIEA